MIFVRRVKCRQKGNQIKLISYASRNGKGRNTNIDDWRESLREKHNCLWFSAISLTTSICKYKEPYIRPDRIVDQLWKTWIKRVWKWKGNIVLRNLIIPAMRIIFSPLPHNSVHYVTKLPTTVSHSNIKSLYIFLTFYERQTRKLLRMTITTQTTLDDFF